jgi:hypothetical protein
MRLLLERKIKNVLAREKEITFAYLYGSFLSSKNFRDIDIAVYLKNKISFKFIVDLKMKLSMSLGLSPDIFDLRVLNRILENPDAFRFFYLKRLFREGRLLVNNNFKVWSDLLEEYSLKYREAEGLISEAVR